MGHQFPIRWPYVGCQRWPSEDLLIGPWLALRNLPTVRNSRNAYSGPSTFLYVNPTLDQQWAINFLFVGLALASNGGAMRTSCSSALGWRHVNLPSVRNSRNAYSGPATFLYLATG